MEISIPRVPLIKYRAAGFNFGFASNMSLLLWCVCGAFLVHFIESNYLAILLKITYETPIHTAEDVLDRGLPIISYPGAESKVEIFKNSPFQSIRTMSERTIVPKVTIVELLNSLFNENLLERIGMNTISCLKMRLGTVLLLLKVPIWRIMRWPGGDGTEVTTGKLQITHLLLIC